MGLFTANGDDVRFHDKNLNERQKPELVLINSLVLTCYISRFYSLGLSFPYFKGQLWARYVLVLNAVILSVYKKCNFIAYSLLIQIY